MDIRKAFEWYSAGNSGLGNKFTKEVIHYSQKISRDIVEYRKYTGDIRYVRLKGFPFSIFFIKNTTANHVFIIAVLHNKRDVISILNSRK